MLTRAESRRGGVLGVERRTGVHYVRLSTSPSVAKLSYEITGGQII